MSQENDTNDVSRFYTLEASSKVVAESGIPTDRFHLGKLLLYSFQEDPDLVLQIDGGTGEYETRGSVLNRSIRCAISLKKCGLQVGDVILLMAPHHLNLSIPFYAATYLGIIVAAADWNYTISELKNTFETNRPKMIFCQSNRVSDIQVALNELGLTATIVTFDTGDHPCNFIDFLEQDNVSIEHFKAADFNAEEAVGYLWPTSGTCGLEKSVALTYKNVALNFSNKITYRKFFIACGLHWLTGLLTYLGSVISKYTQLKTSKPLTEEHVCYLINTYKPCTSLMNPTLLARLIKSPEKCDFTHFETFLLGGSTVPAHLTDELKRIVPKSSMYNVYGMTEACSTIFLGHNSHDSFGKPTEYLQHKLINIGTQRDINEPYVTGELWIKGPSVFKEYYRNSKATEEAFAEGGWFKTGDLFYKDENCSYYYVDRLKMLLKYKGIPISPVEIENVIRQHLGVSDVVVTGITDSEYGDVPVACVVPRPNYAVTAQEIKDIVKGTLSDAKQLRGGVVFMDELPFTKSLKVRRGKIKEMLDHLERE